MLRTVLLVDDAPEVRDIARQALEASGFRVHEAADGDAALEGVGKSPDLVVLDLGLPGMDGLEVLRHIRRTSNVPVIVLTGRGDEADRVLGLELGADDYVVKPFSPRELTARIRALFRRMDEAGAAQQLLSFGDLTIDVRAREVALAERVVACTVKEFDLLVHLARSPRRVFTREQLLQDVWDSTGEWQDERTVTEHVRRLRIKLELDPSSPRWLISVRGVGYRFEP